MRSHFDTVRLGVAAVALMGAGALAGIAQSAPDISAGSMQAVATEIRELRLAVERTGRSQSEVQALGVALSAQQSRLVQLSQRLDAVRRDLSTADGQATQLGDFFKNLAGDAVLNPPGGNAEVPGMFKIFKQQADQARVQAEQLRTRETELYPQIQQEEARWNELIARLDAAAKR